ncbi:MAG: hypothetical protein V7676_07155 [Parasphingorhabdus sp.]|uniref:hypothetical protein n=1 Tax=Parasphingorhabdus sp. TaxID=2709688 RepID=UPI003002743A
MQFRDKTVLMTGGSSDIYRGTVDLFLREDVQVVMGTQAGSHPKIPGLLDALLPALMK